VYRHQYADDTQLFLSLKTSSLAADLQTLEPCSLAVKAWFAENELLLNANKLDAMLIGTSAQLCAADNISCIVVASETHNKVEITCIQARQSVKFHRSHISRQQGVQLPPMGTETHLLTRDVAHTLACRIMDARLDYCNSLLYGASTSNVAKLQRLLNSMARVVMQQHIEEDNES